MYSLLPKGANVSNERRGRPSASRSSSFQRHHLRGVPGASRLQPTAIVEHPVAIAHVAAFCTAAGREILSGVRSSQTISTIRRPQERSSVLWPASAAGLKRPRQGQAPNRSASVMSRPLPMVCNAPYDPAIPPSTPKPISSAEDCATRGAHPRTSTHRNPGPQAPGPLVIATGIGQRAGRIKRHPCADCAQW